MFPTLCDLAGQPLPSRPLDGISLTPVIDDGMQVRPSPLFFWSFNTGRTFGRDSRPYIDPALQEGTTPLAKMMAGKYTRTFRNFHYPMVSEEDFGGPRTMLDEQYKLVIGARAADRSAVELFDLADDPTESRDLAAAQPERVKAMQARMRAWQHSVLRSLTGADYR
jgi:arylsulfatase A-like enzyme